MSQSQCEEWWSDGAIKFYNECPQYPVVPIVGWQHNYQGKADFLNKVKYEQLTCDASTQHWENLQRPKSQSHMESKQQRSPYLNPIGDNGFAWYETVLGSSATWNIDHNNDVLTPIGLWYFNRNLFNLHFKELKYWVVHAEVAEVADVESSFGSLFQPGDLSSIPIEFIRDGPYRKVCGASFDHVFQRDWIATFCKDQRDGQSFDNPNKEHVQLRWLKGTFGWFWLGGRLHIGGQQHYILFCNEKNGGHKLYISAGQSMRVKLESKVRTD